MELGPNSWGDLLFVCKGPNFVRSGKAWWVNTHTSEAALFSWNLRIDAFKRNAGLITWTTSCTQPHRRSQLVFVPRAAETKCMLLLQGITAEKSIFNPKITSFWGKGQALEKKKINSSFMGNPVAITDSIQNEKEVNSAWLKQRKRWSTIGKYGRGGKKPQTALHPS